MLVARVTLMVSFNQPKVGFSVKGKAPYMEGECRMTVFDATSNARTFDYRSDNVGYAPRAFGQHIENAGTTTARLLNVFNLPVFQDISLNQWMALTPPEFVRGHLNLDETAMKALGREVRTVVRIQP